MSLKLLCFVIVVLGTKVLICVEKKCRFVFFSPFFVNFFAPIFHVQIFGGYISVNLDISVKSPISAIFFFFEFLNINYQSWISC